MERATQAAAKSQGLGSALERYLGLPAAKALEGLNGIPGLARQLLAYEESQKRLTEALGHSPIEKFLKQPSGFDATSRAVEMAREAAIPRSVISAEIPKLPPNPIHKTNKHLERVADKFDALLDVQVKQAGLIDLLLKSQVESGKVQGRMAIYGLIIGLVGVVVAVLAIVLSR